MKARILALLDEIKDLCEKEKIPFFLAEELVYWARKGETLQDKFSDASVLVFAADAKRLADKLLLGKTGRAVESLENNPSFPGFYLRYSDTETTLISTKDDRVSYRNNCIGVNIELICSAAGEGFKNKLLNGLKRAWTGSFCPSYIKRRKGRISKKRRIMDFCLQSFLRAAGTEGVMKKLFHAWIRQGSGTSKRYTVAMTNSLHCSFPAKVFQTGHTLTLEGKEYPAPAKPAGYLETTYARPSKRKPRGDMLYDTCVPWRQYSEALKKDGIDLKKTQKNRRRFLEWKRSVYTPLLDRRTYCYNLIFCSQDRVNLWREYGSEKKERVRELYSAGRYGEAREELKDYTELMRHYGKMGVGFCFDPDILELAVKLQILELADTTEKKKTYDKKCGKLLKLVNQVPYQHFDKIENAFFGQRTDEQTLKKEKRLLCGRLEDFCRAHCGKQ